LKKSQAGVLLFILHLGSKEFKRGDPVQGTGPLLLKHPLSKQDNLGFWIEFVWRGQGEVSTNLLLIKEET
jgi:hypothetical protein